MANNDELTALEALIRFVRDELAQRDADAVPNRLRKAAHATGGNLAKPYQRAIVDHLIADEEFRSAIAQRWAETDGEDEIIETFLEDPEAAAPLIAVAGMERTLAGLSAQRDAAKAEVSELEQKLREAKTRIRDAQNETKAVLRDQKESDKRSRMGLVQAAETARQERDALVVQVAEVQGALADLRAAHDQLQHALARATERETRRQRDAGPEPSSESAALGSLPSDPWELAVLLDRIERNLRPYRPPLAGVAPGSADVPVLVIPAGIAPDTATGLASVLALRPDRVLIDGYNVAGMVSGERFSSKEGRNAVLARADMVARATTAVVTVVFDAAESGQDGGFRTDHGVVVEFVGEGSADDAIVRLVHASTDRCVVVTNDRELQVRVARDNCVVVYSTALVAWSEHLNP